MLRCVRQSFVHEAFCWRIVFVREHGSLPTMQITARTISHVFEIVRVGTCPRGLAMTSNFPFGWDKEEIKRRLANTAICLVADSWVKLDHSRKAIFGARSWRMKAPSSISRWTRSVSTIRMQATPFSGKLQHSSSFDSPF